MLEERVPERVVRASSSELRVCVAADKAACCDCKGGRADAFCPIAVRRVVVMVEERVDRRASFSGLGGIGGAGR